MNVCEKCKGFHCLQHRALHVGIGLCIAIAVVAAYLIWLFVSGENEISDVSNGSDVTSQNDASDVFTQRNVFNVSDYADFTKPEVVTLRQPLYVGVMTMERYVGSRAAVCNVTWGRSAAISRLQFFATLPLTHLLHGQPDVINLKGENSDAGPEFCPRKPNMLRQRAFASLAAYLSHNGFLSEFVVVVIVIIASWTAPDPPRPQHNLPIFARIQQRTPCGRDTDKRPSF